MRFWDTSAVVPLLVAEPATRAVVEAYEHDPEVLTWWATEVEIISALARREREGALDVSSVSESIRRLDALARAWREVQPTDGVRQAASRLLRVHALRAADALQLAAAVVASEGHPRTLPFVTLDDRLAEAAQREGFAIVAPGEP